MKLCRIKSVKSLGKQKTFNLTMESEQHNYAVFGQKEGKFVISRNSHACAYTYISMWLIYLKAHYPHEFYTSMLTCETLADKIKDYKMEARVHGVDMHRLDINRSKENFILEGETIFFGFSNVKGIGEAPAKKIVENQPYKSFEDFLIRCGTDASLLKPIIGLRCFRDRDPITLWKFSEHFKDCLKKCEAKRKRYHESVARYEEHFRNIAPGEKMTLNDLQGDMPFDDPYWKDKYNHDEFLELSKEVECGPDEGEPRIVMEEVPTGDDGVIIESEKTVHFKKIRVVKEYNRWKELRLLWKRRVRTLGSGNDTAPMVLPRLVDFDPDRYSIPSELLKEFRNSVICEEKYYGFAWIHELERSPDYRGNFTFDALRNDLNQGVAPVEMQIKSVKRVPSRKGTMYTQVFAEDVTGQQNKLNVWEEDWARWEEEFKVGNLLRVRLQPPSGGFNSFTLESNTGGRGGRYRSQKRYPDKDADPRVVVMRVGQKEEEKILTDEEALEQFDACTMGNPNE